MNIPLITILLVMVVFSGCVMPESNHVEPDFYLLSETELEKNESIPLTELSFYLREVELPRYLKDTRMVFRPTIHTIEFREQKRWGEPLEDGIARVISLNLQNFVSNSNSSIFPNRRKEGLNWDLSVSFSSYEKVMDQIVLKSKWTARNKAGDSVSGDFSCEIPLNETGDELAEVSALNRGLNQIAKQILTSLIPK